MFAAWLDELGGVGGSHGVPDWRKQSRDCSLAEMAETKRTKAELFTHGLHNMKAPRGACDGEKERGSVQIKRGMEQEERWRCGGAREERQDEQS